jgi:hypothetical protein
MTQANLHSECPESWFRRLAFAAGDYRAPSDSGAAVWLKQLELIPENEPSGDDKDSHGPKTARRSSFNRRSQL